MEGLSGLLHSTWGAEKWILEGWAILSESEQQCITQRVDDLFKSGLPFEIKTDKLFYIYTFSLLAQLEVLAIQIPLKFGPTMQQQIYRDRLRQQLLDEIFHGIVFTKIVYMLCAPLSSPPKYNPAIEQLCNFVRQEECPKVAITLLNLIGEGWIEETFYALHINNIAPKVFDIILQDESRHVSEADLYQDIGLPNNSKVQEKVTHIENLFLTNVLMQYEYSYSITKLIGFNAMNNFIDALHSKHTKQLSKINLTPGKQWMVFLNFGKNISGNFKEYHDTTQKISMTPLRKIMMSQWSTPEDPTMVGQFNLNISALDFFNKKSKSNTLNTLILQSISLLLSKEKSLTKYINFSEIYISDDAYVGLVVKLNTVQDHLGVIVFRNCHQMALDDIITKIKAYIKIMSYCYTKREQLEENNIIIQELLQKNSYTERYNEYKCYLPGNPFVSVSNISASGFTQGISPLRPNETLKFTIMQANKHLVWDIQSQSFNPQDLIPISVSADHRVIDGNISVPYQLQRAFDSTLSTYTTGILQNKFIIDVDQIITLIDLFIEKNVIIAYNMLTVLQTSWYDFMDINEILTKTMRINYKQSFYEKMDYNFN